MAISLTQILNTLGIATRTDKTGTWVVIKTNPDKLVKGLHQLRCSEHLDSFSREGDDSVLVFVDRSATKPEVPSIAELMTKPAPAKAEEKAVKPVPGPTIPVTAKAAVPAEAAPAPRPAPLSLLQKKNIRRTPNKREYRFLGVGYDPATKCSSHKVEEILDNSLGTSKVLMACALLSTWLRTDSNIILHRAVPGGNNILDIDWADSAIGTPHSRIQVLLAHPYVNDEGLQADFGRNVIEKATKRKVDYIFFVSPAAKEGYMIRVSHLAAWLIATKSVTATSIHLANTEFRDMVSKEQERKPNFFRDYHALHFSL